MKRFDIIIVGGGAVGCAIAYTLGRYDARIALLERELDVAMGTSGKNSAVVHAGFNNKPGSLMAKLCVEGNKRFEAVCKTLDVPYKKSGKLIVGFNEEDMAVIDALLEDGRKNGAIGLKKIGREEMKALEPNIEGIGAMLSSDTAVFDPFLYCIHLCEAAMQNGVSFFMGNEVLGIRKERESFVITTCKDEYQCKILINAAGLYADMVSAMAGDDRFRQYPCRGEYYILDEKVSKLLSRPVYPAPRKGVGGLGVHFTTAIDGSVLIGPSAEYIEDREDYATTQTVMDQLLREARLLLPALKKDMIIGSYSGIRPKLVRKGEGNFGDFVIEESPKAERLIHLIGIESPGLTASMPIAEMAVGIALKNTPLKEKKGKGVYRAEYRGAAVFAPLSPEKQDRLIEKDANYGEVVCRCRTITKAETLEALRNPLGVKSVVGVKNRVHAMMGRCQGGYCLPKIAEIMMEECGVPPEGITYRSDGDALFSGRLK
ncbi:MAG: NAD(P)/FAD-dependent oxidoreductase [Treponema sp.]|jgi:glycerol-3-phosphate dehydrogenase|nr:NAD(P)/FAD-dependent oxidoreductase [Treponema sp.]